MEHCYFGGPAISIGDGTFLNVGCYFDALGPVEIGRDCQIGQRVTFLTSHHQMGPAERRAGETSPRPITVGDGCWIGAGATLLPGVTVGLGAVIGAGAVVRDDVGPNEVWAGVPARLIRTLDAGPT